MKPIPPMLAKGPMAPFDSDRHSFELKWDGTRCMAFIDKTVVLQNRRLRDITYRYPEFWGLNKSLRAKSAVLDGELVVLEDGIPSFSRLAEREHVIDAEKIRLRSDMLPATYVVFDLLYLDGEPLLDEPLEKRRAILKSLMPISEGVVFSESYASGVRLFKEAIKKGFEGIMAKDKLSPYLPGVRSVHWIKVKKSFDVDAVVCGYTEGEGGRAQFFGSLILGLYDKGRLVYIGRVGTGLSEQVMGQIMTGLRGSITKDCPFESVPHLDRNVTWVRPEMVVRAGYHEFTAHGSMRFPVFKGVRDDKSPWECILQH